MRIITLLAIGLTLSVQAVSAANAAPLETVPSAVQALPHTRSFDGLVEAVQTATIAAETGGRIQEIVFDVDDFVPVGAVLVRFRDSDQRTGVALARAALDEAQARLDRAEQEYLRVKEIFDRKLIARAALDAAVAERDSAQARIKAARAGVGQAEEQLAYTVVRAPYSGIVTARHVEVGELATPGTPLISGLSLDQLRVTVRVPQSVVPALRAHVDDVRVVAGERVITAERIIAFPYADPASHTVTVRAALPAGSDLYPGMFVKLRVFTNLHEQVTVPLSSVIHRGEVTGVYVVDAAGLISLRQIRPGRVHGQTLAVLAGLEAGERIAVDPIAAVAALKAVITEAAQ